MSKFSLVQADRHEFLQSRIPHAVDTRIPYIGYIVPIILISGQGFPISIRFVEALGVTMAATLGLTRPHALQPKSLETLGLYV